MASESRCFPCPHCGKLFDSRGYDNHVTSCRKKYLRLEPLGRHQENIDRADVHEEMKISTTRRL
jgi:hypothetical protein